MIDSLSNALPYGELEMLEVYFEHDGPRFFALRSLSLDVRLLAICTDEDDVSVEYLYLVLSPQRFNQVRSGHIGLREAFETSGPWEIWSVIERHERAEPYVNAFALPYGEIPENKLPTPSARLDIETPTAPPLNEQELRSDAVASLRTFAAIELDANGENLTEFSLRNLGNIGTRLQETFDALAQEETGTPTERGAIAASITDGIQMNVVALRAASFAVVLATDKRGRLMDDEHNVQATLERLVALVETGSNPQILVEALRAYGPRARSKVISLFRAVLQAESGLGILVGPQRADPTSARLTAQQVVEAVELIDGVKPAERDLYIRRGTLLASNTLRGTFLLLDEARQQEYSGRVNEEARDQIDGLRVGHQSYVQAQLIERVEFGVTEQEGGRRYTLTSIAEWADPRGPLSPPL
ncbi:DUF6575 domain-containing protein [Promicromonospora sp. NPDC050262]|uniref:DUF6575 domain-containing protein n=1 Tax=Promicromonospora sp. NPDC050262 TaxID=3155036 RepID=UPI0033EB2415